MQLLPDRSDAAAARLSAQRNLLLAVEARAILDAANVQGVRLLLIKGPVLAVLARDDLAARPFRDLDILAAPGDLPALRGMLERRGYRSTWPVGAREILTAVRKEELMLRDPPGMVGWPGASAVVVELHHHLVDPWLAGVPAFDKLWERRQIVCIAGGEVATLGMEDLLVYLCIHGTGHGWKRAMWAADVDGLIRRHGRKIDWAVVTQRAQGWGAGRALRTGVLVARHLFDTPMPDAVVEASRADRAAVTLARHMMDPLHAHRASRFPPVASFLFQWRTMCRPGDRLRFTGYRLFVPSDQEIRMLPLPRLLWFLYAFIRPVRLLGRALRLGAIRSSTPPG